MPCDDKCEHPQNKISFGRLLRLIQTVPYMRDNFSRARIIRLVFRRADGSSVEIETRDFHGVEIFTDPPNFQ